MRKLITTSGVAVVMAGVALMARAEADRADDMIQLAQMAADDSAQQVQTEEGNNPQDAGNIVREVEDLLGKDVGRVEIQTIGKIKNVLLEDDQLFAVVVLDSPETGDREVVIPFDRLEVGPTNAVTTDLASAEIEELPEYDEEMSDAQVLPESRSIDKELQE